MIITGPAPVKPLIRFAAVVAGLWALGWFLFLQGLLFVLALHAVGVHS